MHREKLKICVFGWAPGTHFKNRTRVFAEKGHDVVLLTTALDPIPGVKQVLIEPKYKKPLCGSSIIQSYLDEIDILDPDLIHVHYGMGYHAWSTLLQDKYPVVMSMMGKDLLHGEQGNPSYGARLLTKYAMRSANAITVKSEYMQGAVARLDSSLLSKTSIIRWGVDAQHFKPEDGNVVRKKLGIREQEKVVLCPRLLQPVYNIDVLIRSLTLIASSESVRLLLFDCHADAPYREKLFSLVKELGLVDNVSFLPPIQHAEMPSYYAAADVVVSIPSSDGLPQSLFETMACHKPLVMSDLPQYAGLVENEKHALLASIEPQAVASCIARLLAPSAMREALVANAFERFLEIGDSKQSVEQMEDIYYRVVQSFSGRNKMSRLYFSALLGGHFLESVALGKER